MADIALTPDEQSQLLSLLSKVEPGFYPIELFWEFARLMTIPTTVFVPFFVEDEAAYVWLIPRDESDRFWPGQLHVPGCVVRPTDNQVEVKNRIVTGEMKGVSVGEPTYVTTEIRKTPRGNEVVTVYYIELYERPKFGELFVAGNLPKNSIEIDNKLIEHAAEAFDKSVSKRAKTVL